MHSLISPTKKIKSVNTEFINYFDSIKYPSSENTVIRTILKKTGFSARNLIDVLKALFHVCLFGLILKMIIPMDIKTFGKKSFITGIPFLRSTFFLPPIILHIALVFLSLGLFYNNKINEKYLFTKYLHKLNFLNIPSFILKISIFYFIYHNLILNMNNHYFFKISGHFLATVITSSMLLNIKNISDSFIKQDTKKKNFTILSQLCIIFIYHNLYSLIFSAWIYHSFLECVISVAIGTFYTLFIEAVNIDQLVLICFFPKLHNSKKTKLLMLFYN